MVGDQQDAVQMAVYKPAENRLIVIADDTQHRWTTATTMVDYETVAAGDKFGNFWLSRLPPGISDEVDNDTTGAGLVHEKPLFNGAAHKLQLLAHFNVRPLSCIDNLKPRLTYFGRQIGDIITSLSRVALVAGGREMIVYTGISGTLGMMVPLQSREDVDFFQTLEMHMRSEAPSLVGRDHLAYRGCMYNTSRYSDRLKLTLMLQQTTCHKKPLSMATFARLSPSSLSRSKRASLKSSAGRSAK